MGKELTPFCAPTQTSEDAMRQTRSRSTRFSRSLLALAVAGVFSTASYAAAIETNWSAIHLQEAWAQGFTGQGVTLGIFDLGVDGRHQAFAGKNIEYLYSDEYEKYYPDALTAEQWNKRNHGTHVAGIMLGQGYGAAQNASLVVLTPAWETLSDTIKEIHELYMKALDAHPEIRIWNNSLGWNFQLNKYAGIPRDDMVLMSKVFDKAAETDRVLVFAAGNEGGIVPNSPVKDGLQAHRYAGHLVNVINIDADRLNGSSSPLFHELQLGQDVLRTNLGVFASVWSIAAPGTAVPSAHAGTGSETLNLTGTSMATPFVAGTLGLVEEAFPWMTSEQLTDVVLSTATPINEALGVAKGGFEEVVITDVQALRDDSELKHNVWNQGQRNNYRFWNDQYEAYEESVAFVYWHSRAEDFDKDTLRKKAEALVAEKYADDLDAIEWMVGDQAALTEKLNKARDKWIDYFVENVVIIENSLGNGLLNAGKAVGGLATIDLNRMARWNDTDKKWMLPTIGYNESNDKQINYTLTLKGDGISRFTNDISEVRWDPTLHISTVEQLFAYSDAIKSGNTNDWYENFTELKAPDEANLPIGMVVTGENRTDLKEGEVNTAGTLVMTGNVRLSGEIDVLKNAVLIVNGSVAGLDSQIPTFANTETALSGLVRSDGTATIGGNGTIQNLISYGVLSPGDDTAVDSVGTLTVTETLTIAKGTILLDVGDNKHDQIIAGTIKWDGAPSGDTKATADSKLTFHLRAGDYIAKDFTFNPKEFFVVTDQAAQTPDFSSANAQISMKNFTLSENTGNGTWSLTRNQNSMQTLAKDADLDAVGQSRLARLDAAIESQGNALTSGAQAIVTWLDRKSDAETFEQAKAEIAAEIAKLNADDHKLLDAALISRTSRIREIAAMNLAENLAEAQRRIVATLSYDNMRADVPRGDIETSLATVAGGMNMGLSNGTFGWRLGAFTDNTEGSNNATELKGTGVFA
ncbi:MAG: S8 family peptidase, partial [Sutterellaceae bacterium]|nr:S8 family peptidase [Sutterellaceae bacterium]